MELNSDLSWRTYSQNLKSPSLAVAKKNRKRQPSALELLRLASEDDESDATAIVERGETTDMLQTHGDVSGF